MPPPKILLENITQQLIEYAQLDFTNKLEFETNEDEFDETIASISMGVNILGEELESKVMELQKAHAELEYQHHFIEHITDVIPETIFIYDVVKNDIVYKNRCIDDNPEVPSLYTITNCGVDSTACEMLDLQSIITNIKTLKLDPNEILITSHGSNQKWLKMMVTPFERNNKGETITELINLTDITESKLKELELIANQEKLTASVEDNQLLLQEIHHRVKNNLQIISGLIDLQINRLKESPVAASQLKETKNRIKSIALIHEKLYQTDNFSSVDMSAYSTSLINSMNELFNYSDTAVDVKLQIDSDIHFSIDKAVPLGLLINEIIWNSYKHAFKDTEKGTIWVTFEQDENEILLKIKDSGEGFEHAENSSKSTSLGMKLIKLLSQQLRGKLSFFKEGGFVTQIILPCDK